MEKLINNITGYHLFNNLFPGIILGASLERLFNINIAGENIIIAFFAYYFIGMVISRIGSLVIEPITKRVMKKCGIKWADKSIYAKAEQSDPKIQTLLQDSNTYRTITAMGLLGIIALVANQIWLSQLDVKIFWISLTAVLLITFIFTASYWKQTKHIISRVNAATKGVK